MNKNILRLTNEDDKTIANEFHAGDHTFYSQDLEEMNKKDAYEWFENDEMTAIVSELHGGIIGYVHREHADDIATILNLHVIERIKKEERTI